jgi:hypothetical protein
VNHPWLRPVLVVLAIGLSAWLVVLLVNGGDDFKLTTGEPKIASVSDLESWSEDSGRTIYWVGERPNSVYELTETSDGRVYVRYLPEGAEAGDPAPGYVTVGTYPVKDAAGALRDAAKGKGKELAMSKNGAVVLLETHRAENVHMAFPNTNEQIEIYSPDPKVALGYASGDRVTAVP